MSEEYTEQESGEEATIEEDSSDALTPVSYTHLTLPTILLV